MLNKRFLVLLFILIGMVTYVTECRGQWSKYQEFVAIQKAADVGKTFGLNDKQAYDYGVCCVEKIKRKFPDLKKSTEKQIYDYAKIVGKSCFPLSTIKTKWTPELEKMMRSHLLTSSDFSIFTPEYREKIVDCMILKIKEIHPIEVTKITDEEAEKISEECSKELQPRK